MTVNRRERQFSMIIARDEVQRERYDVQMKAGYDEIAQVDDALRGRRSERILKRQNPPGNEVKWAVEAEDSMFQEKAISFPRSAWECRADAPAS